MSDDRRRVHRIAVVGGDGVGPEVVEAGLRVLQAAATREGTFALETASLPWGSDHYARTGRMMPEDGLETLARFDAIYLGAVGSPAVPDDVTLWGLLLPIRQRFDLYVNLRPVRLLSGVRSPVGRGQAPRIDMMCVRENTEGEYCGVGGRVHEGHAHDLAIQADVFTRRGVERIARYAFDLAQTRSGRLASITKSNAGRHAFVFWDQIIEEVARDYPSVQVERLLVDAAAAYFVTTPERFDVVVGSNLFLDILTDLGAAIQGGMGLAASANLSPDRSAPAMFEPVHGSAPDIAGRGVANPVGAIWAGAMMLDYLGEASAAGDVMRAVELVLAARATRTPDLGGDSSTKAFTDAVLAALASSDRVHPDGAVGTTLRVGMTGEFGFDVTEPLLTDVRGALRSPVLSTPGMIAMMERTAASLAASHLPAGRATVGFHVDVKHVASIGPGARCTARARVTQVVDDRKLRFEVEVLDDGGRTLGVGTHERRVIDGR